MRILDPYFEVVRPHLDRIMERMDEIEPHLPFILLNLAAWTKKSDEAEAHGCFSPTYFFLFKLFGLLGMVKEEAKLGFSYLFM